MSLKLTILSLEDTSPLPGCLELFTGSVALELIYFIFLINITGF